MSRLLRWGAAFWFSESGSPRQLAAVRIVISVHALWVLASRNLAEHSGLPEEFWMGVPRPMLWRFGIVPGHVGVERTVELVAGACLVAVLLGVFPRLAALVAAVALYHLGPFQTIIWAGAATERGLEVTVLALVVLAVAPSSDAWAVSSRGSVPPTSWQYHWPVMLIRLFVVQIYLFAGYSKLVLVGPDWISANTIRNLMLAFDQSTMAPRIHAIGLWIADRSALSFMTAVFGMTVDLGFIVILFWRRGWMVILPIALLFHLGIMLTTTIYFLNWPQLLVFVDWDLVTTWVKRRRRVAAPAVLVPTP